MRQGKYIISLVCLLLYAGTALAYNHADTLRGSNGTGRSWWDVQHYSLSVVFNFPDKSIIGSNVIELKVTDTPHDSLQIDLQEPMVLDSIYCDGIALDIMHEHNVWWVKYPFHNWHTGTTQKLYCYYHGRPRTAIKPPWDGGFVWTTDEKGKPWVSVACQGLGASVWWPCKDAQWDEPDNGQDMEFTAPDSLQCISNGRLMEQKKATGNNTYWHWQVKNPINNYDVTFYIGDYIHWSDTLNGEKGILQLDFYALRDNETKARKQFEIVKPMLHCFEYWMGPYPFYEDGYKLVEAPYLGMEHQSAVAYGNKYMKGYLGMDRSGTGIGYTFDYIIVHETGHEWFGNSVTAKDIADNWIHEGITTWSEALFVDCMKGQEASKTYSEGKWDAITNDRPLIGDYNVNNEGSGDIYRKGAAMMYMIRELMNNDEQFRKMMRGLSLTFYHKTVTSAEVEDYIASYLPDMDMKPFFNQYLRANELPRLAYYVNNRKLFFRFEHSVTSFTLPITVKDNKGKSRVIYPTDDWQSVKWKKGRNAIFNKSWLITINKTN